MPSEISFILSHVIKIFDESIDEEFDNEITEDLYFPLINELFSDYDNDMNTLDNDIGYMLRH